MIASVKLAGRTRRWRLLQGHRLTEWLAAEPWWSCEAPLLAQVSAPLVDTIIDETRGEVRKTLGTSEYVRVEALGQDICEAGPRTGLWRWMNIPEGSPRALAERLANLSKQTPWLYIARLGRSWPAASWMDELQRVLDIQAKLPDSGRLTFIILDAGRAPAADACRLDLAWPETSATLADREDRWAAYLHERIAWHAGGNLQVALDAAGGLSRLSVGDDIGLERALDAHAEAALDEADDKALEAMCTSLAPVLHDPWLQIPPGLAGFESRSRRPAPWVARGLLLRCPEHPNRRYLRSLCVCRPLANRLLGRCQDLEQKVRDRLLARPLAGQPSDQAIQTAQRLATRLDAIEHRLTPAGRLEERDPWEVAPLHDLIRASCESKATLKSMHRLRRVRNALAHGSPVGWEAFEIVEGLESRLGVRRAGAQG